MKPLYKTTTVIWSTTDPSLLDMDFVEVSQDAMTGNSYCSRCETVRIEHPEEDPDWDGTEFFADDDDDDEEAKES